MKIDVFNHILTPKYCRERAKIAPAQLHLAEFERQFPTLLDVDSRFRVMDTAGEGYVQILTLANPPVEALAGPKEALALSRMANDEMAELVSRHPHRFVGAAACIPMNEIEGALAEIERSVKELGFCGIQLYSHVLGHPLDEPRFAPVFEKMAELGLPILLHPARGPDFADYPSEKQSRYDIWRTFGWLFDTVAAMTRLIFAGVFDRYPDLKIVTHHLGGFVPYACERIREGYDKVVKRARLQGEALPIRHHPYEYFHRFYADTVTVGSVAALQCGLDFFGVDHVVWATDMPFDTEGGFKYVREALRAMETLEMPPAQKRQIFEENARRLFKL